MNEFVLPEHSHVPLEVALVVDGDVAHVEPEVPEGLVGAAPVDEEGHSFRELCKKYKVQGTINFSYTFKHGMVNRSL